MKAVYRQIDIDGSGENTPELEDTAPKTQGEEEIKTDNAACRGVEREAEVAPENELVPVFEQVGWKQKVQEFLQAYPVAKDFSEQIGRIIADSETLSQDESCLEKALANALAKAYVSPRRLASDEAFLQEYIFVNQAVKDRIIQEYLDNLQHNLPPKSISSRGQITLTPPSKPSNIAEAGQVFKAMFDNRRI